MIPLRIIQESIPNMNFSGKRSEFCSNQRLNAKELVTIIPSYQLDQSIFGESLALDVFDYSCPPPDYSYTTSLERSFEDEFNDASELPTLPSDSVIHNLTSLPYSNSKNIGMEILLDQDQTTTYREGDVLEGVLKLENLKNIYIPFDLLLVTLEGRMTFTKTKDRLGNRTYSRQNFLVLVDFSSSFTEADNLLNPPQEVPGKPKYSIPMNKRIPPLSSFERHFQFTIPQTSIHSDENSLSEDLSLPPSIGSLNHLYPIDPSREQDWKSYKQEKNDLTGLDYSISYSINARMISRNSNSKHYAISCHSESFFKFVPTTPTPASCSLNPTQQLKLLLRLTERQLQLATRSEQKIKFDSSSSSRDPEKSQNMVGGHSLLPAVTDVSKISFDDCPTFQDEAQLIKRRNKLLPRFEACSPIQGTMKILSQCTQEPFILTWDGNSNEIKIQIELIYEPSVVANEDFSISESPQEFMPIISPNMNTELGIIKINTAANPVKFDLDCSWFLNKEAFETNLRKPISRIIKSYKSLPRGTEIPTRVASDIMSLASLRPLATHIFDDALLQTITEGNWQVEDTERTIFKKSVCISLKLDPNFTKRYSIAPSFHTSQLARFYSLVVSLNLSQKSSKMLSINKPTILIELPIEVQYEPFR